MARIVTAVLVHDLTVNCSWRQGVCTCSPRHMVVDTEFDVPEDATIREAIPLARQATLDAALRMVQEESD